MPFWFAVLLAIQARFGAISVFAADLPDLRESMEAIFQPWDRPDLPGCSLGIARGHSPPLFLAVGSADLEHDARIERDTVFEAGSVSKQFTATLILMLAEQGKLSLADDVRKYVPELPDYGSMITINELLGHTSGLREWEDVAAISGWPRTTRRYTQKDVLEMTSRQKHLNFKPGSEYSYSNTGYVLLAIIVERVSGKSFADFSREQIFTPLGLSHSGWRDDFRAVVRGRARAYQADSNRYREFMPLDDVIGSGGLLTTVSDLLAWNSALEAGRLGAFVTAELQRASGLEDGRTIPYARGLKLSNYRGYRQVWHNGETAGYQAFLARYPDRQLSIALLCNAGEETDATVLGDKVADVFLSATAAESDGTSAHSKTPARRLALYTGTFFSRRSGFQLQLDAQAGVLKRLSDGHQFFAVVPGVFKDAESTVTFEGSDRFVREFIDGRRAEFSRVQPWNPTAEQLSAFTGRYQSEEALATVIVSLVDGHLLIARDDRRWDVATLDVLSVDTFMAPHTLYRFVRDGNHKIVRLEISKIGVYDIAFQRAP